MNAGVGALVPLPGTVDVSRCCRVNADVGKCSVCGVAPAEWVDREAGVKLCGRCYGRGVSGKQFSRIISRNLNMISRGNYFEPCRKAPENPSRNSR
ncbi:hypothetical protein [uncultured Methanoregula sp.]|uniref:hypothetical protein n=1 Tax=uncultured Methanoregula sp. TaxID=1005933 RepID=UPI002AAB51F7|nr:hypothetical protein [uncultured Methanoregula sp.]